MRAVVVASFGGPDVLRVEDVPVPRAERGQILIDVRAIGINPVETYVRSGTYPRLPPLPYVPGTDAAGVVEAVGPGVRGFKPGDRVYTHGTLTGAYAEKVVASSATVFPLPKKLSFDQGAALGIPYGTAHRALFHHGAARRGTKVLIHGASGGVGVAAVQLAKAARLAVFGTGGGADGAAFVKKLGVDHAFDHRDPSYVDALRKAAPQGFDLIVEMLANVNLPTDLSLLAPRGKIVVVGNRGPVTVDLRAAMTKDASIIGMSLWNLDDASRRKIHSAMAPGLASGKLSPVIAHRFPFAEASAAHAAVMAPSARGKIVLNP